jgi:hypothetical protein
MMPRTITRTTANASPKRVPILMFPRNILFLLVFLGTHRGSRSAGKRC